MTYKFAKGFQLKQDPQTVGEHLAKLQKKYSSLNAEVIKNDAKNERSPLHDEFEWDDTLAADAWRTEQARYVLRSVTVIMEDSKGNDVAVRAFVNVTDGEYTPMEVVLKDSKLTGVLLLKAAKELYMWKERYGIYLELANICGVIEAQAQRLEERATAAVA